LALKFHPDKNRDAGAEDRFKTITHAYSVLADKV
jgi:DnaJ-class molecular chaperone